MKTVKDYNLTLNSLKHKQQHEKISTVLFYQVCADTVKAKQSIAEYGCRLCLFCPSNKLIFDLLTLKVLSESHVTWATSVPILVFLGLSVLDLGPMYTRQTDVRQTDVRQHNRLGGGIITRVALSRTYIPPRRPLIPQDAG